jgi:hypothetical protein
MSENSSELHVSDNDNSEQGNIEEEDPFEDEILNEEIEDQVDETDTAVEIQQVSQYDQFNEIQKLIINLEER